MGTSYDDETGNVISYTDVADDATKRTGWYWNSNDSKDDRYAPHEVHQDGMFYVGIEDSLKILHNEWTKAIEEGRPYDGIFGFSQGVVKPRRRCETRTILSWQMVPYVKPIAI